MCLDKLHKNITFPKEVLAYKCFDIKYNYADNILCLILPWQSYKLKVNTWNRASNDWLFTDESNEKYKSGFHVFKYKTQAENSPYNIIIPVTIKNILAAGLDCRFQTYVAKHMFIDKSILIKEVEKYNRKDFGGLVGPLKAIRFCGQKIDLMENK